MAEGRATGAEHVTYSFWVVYYWRSHSNSQFMSGILEVKILFTLVHLSIVYECPGNPWRCPVMALKIAK